MWLLKVVLVCAPRSSSIFLCLRYMNFKSWVESNLRCHQISQIAGAVLFSAFRAVILSWRRYFSTKVFNWYKMHFFQKIQKLWFPMIEQPLHENIPFFSLVSFFVYTLQFYTFRRVCIFIIFSIEIENFWDERAYSFLIRLWKEV